MGTVRASHSSDRDGVLDSARCRHRIRTTEYDHVVISRSYIGPPASQGPPPGPARDVNGDGALNLADVHALIMMIMGQLPEAPAADVDRNGQVGVGDARALLRLLGEP